MAEVSLLMLKQENLELYKENAALKTTVSKLLEELNKIRNIKRPTELNKITQTTEQRIVNEQINYFDAISAERALSLEETRALDLLIKNKRLLDEKISIEPDYTKVPEGQTESDLLRIAGNVESEKEESGK